MTAIMPRFTILTIELSVIELPKFQVNTFGEKKLKAIWLRYLSEIQNGQEMLSQELLKELNSVPEVAEALELTKESGYTKAELEVYDKYWDTIRTERTLIADAEAKGIAQGREEGREEGIEQGEQNKQTEFILTLFEDGIPLSQIAKYAKLSVEDVEKILKEQSRI